MTTALIILVAALGSLSASVVGAFKLRKANDWPPRRTIETTEEIPF